MVTRTLLAVTVLAALANGVIFNCNFTLESRVVLGEVYHCRPTVSNTGTKTLQNVTGNHLGARNNSDVKYLYVYNQNLNYVPANINHFFPNLTGLEWYNSNLLSVTSEDLRPFPQLIIFSSFINKLVEIDGDLFEFTPNLRWISFYNNLLEHIGNDLLTNLTVLEQVGFQLNPCIGIYASTTPAIQDLNRQLPISCPPRIISTTTFPATTSTTSLPTLSSTLSSSTSTLSTSTLPAHGQCSADCLERIESSEDEIKQLQAQVTDQRNIIVELLLRSDAYESRIVELEIQMREIGSQPCSPCAPS